MENAGKHKPAKAPAVHNCLIMAHSVLSDNCHSLTNRLLKASCPIAAELEERLLFKTSGEFSHSLQLNNSNKKKYFRR